MHFETPHNDIKFVLSVIELFVIEKMGQNFHICPRSGPTESKNLDSMAEKRNYVKGLDPLAMMYYNIYLKSTS